MATLVSTPPTTVRQDLQDIVLESTDMDELLTGFATLTASALSADDEFSCAMVLAQRKKVATAASDQRTLALDELQHGYHQGPCLAALRDHTTVHAPALREERRWPLYCTAAWGEGFGSVLSVPLTLREEPDSAAVMSVYSPRDHAFTGSFIDAAEEYAAEASKTLCLAARLGRLADDRAHLAAAMESRTVIDQPQG